MTKVYKARLIKHTNALQSIFVQSQEHHRPKTSIRRRGKWETLAKSDKRLGGSDVTEAGDGEAGKVAPPPGGFRSVLIL